MSPVLVGLLAIVAGSVQDPGAAGSIDPVVAGRADAVAAHAEEAAGRSEEIDRVVAVVRSGTGEPRVITRSRLEEETRIAIIARGGILAATEPLDDAVLSAGLEALLDETLLSDDAARLQVFDADAQGGDDLVAAFRARFLTRSAYEAFLARWDVSEEDLAAVLRRKARIRRYLDSRMSNAGSQAEVNEFVRSLRARADIRILARSP